MSRYWTVLGLLIALCHGGHAAATPAPIRPDTSVATDQAIATYIDGYLSAEIERRGIPGAGVVVVRDGRTILERGYGVANYDDRRPLTPNHVLRQGSISKLFVWLLAMQLVEEGRLDLDKDVNAYLDFQIPRTFDAPITMRRLMTHTAGFDDRMPLLGPIRAGAPLGELLKTNIPDRVYPPGEVIAYSNYGAGLASYVVQRVGGKPFERLVEERLFRKIGMTHSTFDQPIPARLRPWLASTYSASSRVPHRFEMTGLPGIGSLSATPADMGRLLQVLMNGGVGPGGAVATPSALLSMTRLQAPLGPNLQAGMGQGFIVGEYRGVRHAGHGGSMAASISDLQMLPEERLGWSISFNGRGIDGAALPLRQDLLRAVIDRFYAAEAGPIEPRGPSSAVDVAGAYLPARRPHSGIFKVQDLNAVEITAAPDGSLITHEEGGPTRWTPQGRDRFVEEKTRLPMAITRDSAGRVVGLASPYLNTVTSFDRAPSALRYAPVVLAVAPIVLLAVALGRLAAWVWRRRRPSFETDQMGPTTPLRRGLQRYARLSVWLTLATLAAWAACVVGLMLDPGLIFRSATFIRALQAVSAMTALFAAICLTDAVLAWFNGSRGWVDRTVATAAAGAVVGVAWLLFTFDLAHL